MSKNSRQGYVIRKLSKLEERSEQHEDMIKKHDELLLDIHEDIGRLVEQVKGIRSALYMMAVVILGNIPALQPVLSSLKALPSSFIGEVPK